MDIADEACEIQAMYNRLALANIIRPCGESAEYCEDCDEPIPLARRQAIKGVRRCIDCQALYERTKSVR